MSILRNTFIFAVVAAVLAVVGVVGLPQSFTGATFAQEARAPTITASALPSTSTGTPVEVVVTYPAGLVLPADAIVELQRADGDSPSDTDFSNLSSKRGTPPSTITDSSGRPNTAYTYRVVVKQPSGSVLATSNQVSVTTAAFSIVLTATASNGEVQLRWTKPDSGYSETDNSARIKRALEAEPPFNSVAVIAVLNRDTVEYTDTAVVEGTEYSYWVDVDDEPGDTDGASNMVRVTTRAPIDGVVVTTSEEIHPSYGHKERFWNLSWNRPDEDVSGYEIERTIGGDVQIPNVQLASSSNTSAKIIINLPADEAKVHSFRVRAARVIDIDPAINLGPGPWSPTITKTPTDEYPAYQMATLSGVFDAATGSVVLNWTDPPTNAYAGGHKYKLERRPRGSNNWVSLPYAEEPGDRPSSMCDSDGNCSFTDTTVVPGLRYLYRLTDLDMSGKKLDEDKFALPGPIPPLPPYLLKPTVDESGVTLAWEMLQNTDGITYNVYRKAWSNGVVDVEPVATTTDERYLDTLVKPATVYHYWVTAQKGVLKSDNSNVRVVPIEGPTAGKAEHEYRLFNRAVRVEWEFSTSTTGSTSTIVTEIQRRVLTRSSQDREVGQYKLIRSTRKSISHFLDTSLPAGQIAQYRVVARTNGQAEILETDWVYGTTLTATREEDLLDRESNNRLTWNSINGLYIQKDDKDWRVTTTKLHVGPGSRPPTSSSDVLYSQGIGDESEYLHDRKSHGSRVYCLSFVFTEVTDTDPAPTFDHFMCSESTRGLTVGKSLDE